MITDLRDAIKKQKPELEEVERRADIISTLIEIETKTTGENLAGNQENSNLWNSFANEKTREEEEEMDALLLEAEDESAMDQFLLQAVSENEPENVQPTSYNDDDDLFLLDVAQYLP